MRSEPTPRARRYGAALLLVVLGTLLGAWHNRATDRGRSDLVAGAVRGVVAPPAGLLGRLSHWTGDQTAWLFHGHALAAENAALRARIAQLEGENVQLGEARIKYDQLRADMNFVRLDLRPKIAADVVARRPDPKFDTCMIDQGSLAGVRHNSVVVTRNGVVGHVTEVTPTTASVLMLTDSNSGVGARTQRSRAEGICNGKNRADLDMENLRNDANVKPGDLVVTSGMGKVFPPGLVIGTVGSLRSEEGNLMKTAQVHPAVDFDRLEQVYVIP